MKKKLCILLSCILLIGATGDLVAKRQQKKSAPARTERTSSAVKKDKQENAKKINKTKKDIELNAKQTKKRLNDLNFITADVEKKASQVDSLQQQVDLTAQQIAAIDDSITTITANVKSLKESSAKSLREERARRQSMSPLALVFSSKNFNQASKRIGYIKQLDKVRNKKTQSLKENLGLLDQKQQRLTSIKEEQTVMLASLSGEQDLLKKKQGEMMIVVEDLRKHGGALQKELDARQSKARELDRELDRIIAREAEKAAAEARHKAEQEKARKEAEARRQAEERRKQIEAEAAARAEAQRIKEEQAKQTPPPIDEKAQKEADKKAKKAAEEKAKQDEKIKAEAQKQAEKAEKAAKKKAEDEAKKAQKEQKSKGKDRKSSRKNKGERPAPVEPTAPEPKKEEPVRLEENFEGSKGRLLFPVSGKYTIVGKFGRNRHANLSMVETDNAGIDIEAASGAAARAVYDGVVSSIFQLDGYHNIVMLRHGEYLTVYANISNLSVRKGDRVKSGQVLGKIFADPDDNNRSILHFEVRREREKLNPMEWVRP